MFFYLSKILNFASTPLFWIFLLLILGLLYKKANLKKLAVISTVLLYFFSNRFIFTEVMRQWEAPAISIEDVVEHDMAIVLGGMIDYDAELDRMQVFRGFDRIVQATELYNKGKVKKLFISGGSGSILYPEIKESKIIRDYFISLGIPDEDILYEDISRNTYENALYTKQVLEEKNLLNSSFILVTSGFHMKRSQACYNKIGIITIPFSTDRYGGPRRYHLDNLLIPSPEILFNWNVLFHEWLGMIAYKVAGYI
jgi:uncharacterized SAM-binding protein YcdF (DUF218 family)